MLNNLIGEPIYYSEVRPQIQLEILASEFSDQLGLKLAIDLAAFFSVINGLLVRELK